MKLKNLRFCLIIILWIASLIPIVTAPNIQPEPIDSNDDAFITGAGNYFGDTPYLFLRDEVTNLVLGTRFRNVNIAQGQKINNATLFVRSVYTYAAAGDIRVTITGDDADDSLAFNDSGSFTRTYTHAYVVWNISDVNGDSWHNVSVTEIVQEIIDRVDWQSGNDLSLVFFTDRGIPRREFASVDGNPAFTAYIDINYGIPPPPGEVATIQDNSTAPYNDTTVYVWEYNETYRGIDIFLVSEMGNPELLIVSSNNLIYFNTTKGDPNYNNWATPAAFSFQSAGCVEFIATLGDWTYLIGRNNTDAQIFYSDDEFQTWQVDTINTHFPRLSGHDSDYGSILADQNGSDVIHVVYSSFSDWNPARYDIIYTNFTMNPATETLVWSTDYFNVTTDVVSSQTDADIYQEKDATLHIAWEGPNGTANDIAQYRRRQSNGTWLDGVRLSSDDVTDAFEIDIVANEDTGVAMAMWTRLQVGNWDIRWDVVFPNNTVGTAVGTSDRAISNAQYVSAVTDRDSQVAHMVYTDYAGDHIEYVYKVIDNSTAWSAAQQVSLGVDRHSYPVVALDEENNTLACVWWNNDGTETDWNVWQVGSAPTPADTLLLNLELRYPSMADYWNRAIIDQFIFLVYPNGTFVDPDPLGPGESPYDEIDDLLGGAQPEDPQTDYYGPLNKFSWKLLILAIGMIMMIGSPLAGVIYGADTATWIKLLFVAFFGLGILWQIKFM